MLSSLLQTSVFDQQTTKRLTERIRVRAAAFWRKRFASTDWKRESDTDLE